MPNFELPFFFCLVRLQKVHRNLIECSNPPRRARNGIIIFLYLLQLDFIFSSYQAQEEFITQHKTQLDNFTSSQEDQNKMKEEEFLQRLDEEKQLLLKEFENEKKKMADSHDGEVS